MDRPDFKLMLYALHSIPCRATFKNGTVDGELVSKDGELYGMDAGIKAEYHVTGRFKSYQVDYMEIKLIKEENPDDDLRTFVFRKLFLTIDAEM